MAAKAETAARTKLLRQLARVLRQRLVLLVEQERGVSLAGLRWRRRYHSEADFNARERRRKSRAREHGYAVIEDGTLTGRVVRSLFAAATTCPYCGDALHPRQKTLDHLIPISRGGEHSILNVVVCCGTCNARKHARTALEFVFGVRLSRRMTVTNRGGSLGHTVRAGTEDRGLRLLESFENVIPALAG